MAEYQIVSWRELPSMVTAREGDEVVKVQLAPRFQEAIDEAAIRMGDTGSDAYLAGWSRSEWLTGEGDPADLANAVSASLDNVWSEAALAEFLNTLVPLSGN